MLIINEIPHLNRLDQSTSVQRVVAIYSHFTFIFRLNVLNSEDRKETPPHSVAPHLGLLCLSFLQYFPPVVSEAPPVKV